ncbi:tuberoinfundibular peptide of 39 residues [Arapaima gigas]
MCVGAEGNHLNANWVPPGLNLPMGHIVPCGRADPFRLWVVASEVGTHAAAELSSRHPAAGPKMFSMVPPPRSALLLLALLCMTLASSSFPVRHAPSAAQEDSKMSKWEVLYPSISLLDWSLQMMSTPEFAERKSKPGLMANKPWLHLSQSEMEDLTKTWPSNWSTRVGHEGKRNIVVADDAAFREKSKLLTAMERQKWLNSYMQKLLVVNSQ